MGEEQILQLAQEFLFSDAGKKLVGKDIDLDSLKNQVLAQSQEEALKIEGLNVNDIEAQASGIDYTKVDVNKVKIGSGEKKPTLTREERKKQREEEKKLSREEKEKLREEKELEREKRKEARQERGGTVGQFIPKFQEYLITGRVYDQYENIPVSGVKIQLAIKDPVKGFPIPIGGEKRVFKTEDGKKVVEKRDVYTDLDGKFSIYVRLPYLPYNGKILLETFLLYTKSGDSSNTKKEYNIKGYLPAIQPIITREREVKTSLPEFPLIDLATAAVEALPTYLGEYYPIYNTTRDLLLNPKQQVLVLRKKQILKTIKVIQTRLLPVVIELLLTFGITKLNQRNQKVCPPASTLQSSTERRNRVVRQLNQVFRQVTINTAIAAALTAVAALIRTNRSIILNLPLPLGAPIGVGVPYSAVAKLQEVQAVLETLEEDNRELNKQIVNGLILLTASISSILILLRLLDELTQECAGELNLNPEAISQELVDLTNEASEEGISTTNRINGFTLEVQSLDQDAVGNLKRRQAVGKNSQGIIMIKGDPSFSSNDQILINELAFYIQSNNLKAF